MEGEVVLDPVEFKTVPDDALRRPVVFGPGPDEGFDAPLEPEGFDPLEFDEPESSRAVGFDPVLEPEDFDPLEPEDLESPPPEDFDPLEPEDLESPPPEDCDPLEPEDLESLPPETNDFTDTAWAAPAGTPISANATTATAKRSRPVCVRSLE